MSLRSAMVTLAPAIGAGISGVAGHLVWSDPSAIVAAAVLGAGLGAILTGHEHASGGTRMPTHPNDGQRSSGMIEPLLAALPMAALIVGPDRAIRRANVPAAELFGLPETVNVPVATLRTRRLLDGIGQVLEHGEATEFEFALPRSIDTHLRAHVSRIGSEGMVAVVIEDQTEMRRSLARHRDFVANASHELKTPLATVTGLIETLLGHARQDPVATERFLHMLSGQTVRMTRLVEDLLSLNRIELNERVQPDVVLDLVPTLHEVVDSLRPTAEAAEVHLNYRAAGVPFAVLGDRNEIDQLFRNLIDNAVKYGGPGTQVDVRIREGTGDLQGYAVVSISDQGPGIAREHLPRLTERFYRINAKHSRDKGGTGLGLAICKHVVNRHRGKLEIQSKPGKGSTFAAILPLAVPGTPVAAAVPPPISVA